MIGKLVFFILVAFCAVQGFQSRTIETRSIIDDTIQSIKDLITKIQDGISELVNSIPSLLTKLEETIQSIIDKIIEDTKNVIRKIADATENILEMAGVDVETAKTCIGAENTDIENLIKETTASIEKCKKDADKRKEEIREEMEELKTKSFDLIKEINGGLWQCFRDHALNPIKYVKCLTGHLEAVKEKSEALLRQIRDTIFTANKTAGDIAVTLIKCTANINAQVITGHKNIIDNFNQCVDEIKQQQ